MNLSMQCPKSGIPSLRRPSFGPSLWHRSPLSAPFQSIHESREQLAERDKHVTTPGVLLLPERGEICLWKEGPNGRTKRGEESAAA